MRHAAEADIHAPWGSARGNPRRKSMPGTRGFRGFTRGARRVSNLRHLACEARSRGWGAAARAGFDVLICRSFFAPMLGAERALVAPHFEAIRAGSGTGAQTMRPPSARAVAATSAYSGRRSAAARFRAPRCRYGRAPSVSTDDQLTLASVSDCGIADIVARHDRWSSIPVV